MHGTPIPSIPDEPSHEVFARLLTTEARGDRLHRCFVLEMRVARERHRVDVGPLTTDRRQLPDGLGRSEHL
jgi:hypothetical protein